MAEYGSSEISSENFIRGYIGGIGKCWSWKEKSWESTGWVSRDSRL